MRIHHLALRVGHCERAARFYSGLLGLEEIRRTVEQGTVRSIWLSAGDSVLMLELSLRGRGAAEGSGHVLVFEAEELGSWERRLEGAGIPLADRTDSTLYVSDPDGHRVGLTVFGRAVP